LAQFNPRKAYNQIVLLGSLSVPPNGKEHHYWYKDEVVQTGLGEADPFFLLGQGTEPSARAS